MASTWWGILHDYELIKFASFSSFLQEHKYLQDRNKGRVLIYFNILQDSQWLWKKPLLLNIIKVLNYFFKKL